MLEYSYAVDDRLRALNEGSLLKTDWEQMGKPCVFVQYATPVMDGSFAVGYDDLSAFAEADLNLSDESSLLDVFASMLDVENYVENVYLR